MITDPENTAVGDHALFSNFGQSDTATGFKALFNNMKGAVNVANGDQALFANENGNGNTAVGAFALSGNTDGDFNTAVGEETLVANTTGDDNSSLGSIALRNITGNFNVAVGSNAGNHVISADHVICIGSDVPGADVSNSCFIGQIFGATSSDGAAVFVNSDGKLGTTTSSRRFKEEIRPMDKVSEALFALRPVTFRYK